MLNKLLAAALLFCGLAIGVGWARGTTTPNGYAPYGEYGADASYMVLFINGQVRFSHWWYEEGLLTLRNRGGEWLGVGFMVKFIQTPLGQTLQIHRVWLPTWVLMSMVVAYPVVSGLRWVSRRVERKRRFRCRACGYSLIALVEPRCPECGIEVTIPTQASAADYVDPIVYTRYRFTAAIVLLLTISGAGLWWTYSQSRPNAASATPASRVLPPPVMTLTNTSLSTMRIAASQPWLATYSSSTKFGCPICGPNAWLINVMVSKPKTGWLGIGQPFAYRCGLCQMLLGLDHKKHPFPMACKKCGRVVTDLSGDPSPWCEDCACPNCQWTPCMALPSD